MSFLQEETGRDSGPINYYRDAFLVPHNCIALAGAAAFSLVALSLFPLLAALGVELMYLSAVPSNPRFQRWVRSRRSEAERRQEQLELFRVLKQIPPAGRKKYTELERMCQSIRSNYSQLSSTSQVLLGQIQQSLGNLLQTYLRLISTAHQHSSYLDGAGPQDIRQEMERLERSLPSESSEVQEVNQRRLPILQERLAKSKKILENKKVLDAQCAAIEDMIRLMREHSLTLRDPQQISDRLDALLQDARHTEETVKEVESFFEVETTSL